MEILNVMADTPKPLRKPISGEFALGLARELRELADRLEGDAQTIRPPVKCALRDPAKVEHSAEWLRRAREILGVTGEQMAEAVGCSARTWWSYECGETVAPITLYWTVSGLLGANRVDSTGRIRIAGAAS